MTTQIATHKGEFNKSKAFIYARRAATQDPLREGVLTEGWRLNPGSYTVAAEVGAAMYTGAMAELAQQWLAGHLGDDLDRDVIWLRASAITPWG